MNATPRLLALLTTAALLSACRKDEASSAPATSEAASVVAPRAIAPALVAGQGSVEGRVRLDGALALPPLPTTASVSDVCGAEVIDHSVRVDAAGGLADAVVFLDVGAGPVLEGERQAMLDQKGCIYSPAVVAARAGTRVKVTNSDPLVHNVRSVAEGRSLFNVGMPLEGTSIERPLPTTPGVVSIGCDLHPWMRATVRTFDHGWFTVTDESGAFRLEGLPEGRHTLKVWHPRLPEQSFELDLKAGAAPKLEPVWRADQVRAIEALPRSQR